MNQEYLVVCDKPGCDFKVKNETGIPNDGIEKYLNMSCPLCGENLLTEDDYRRSVVFLGLIGLINRWFSWITVFYRHKKQSSVYVKIHDGITVNDGSMK